MSGSASPFRKRTAFLLVLAGLVAMLGFLLTSAYGDRFERQRGNIPSATSRFATGFQGLYDLIEGAGGTASLSGNRFDRPDGVLILTPNIRTTPEELVEALNDHEGSVLIVLPKWIAAPQKARPNREERFARVTPDLTVKLLEKIARVEPHTEKPETRLRYAGGIAARPFRISEAMQAIKSERLTPVIGAPDGALILGQLTGTSTFILADPDLLNNYGLAHRENAQAAIALLAALDPDHPGQIAFDTMLPYGAGGRNLAQLMFEAPFAGVTIALLAAALLAGIAAFARFGPVRREPRALAFGKRALIENIVALARRARRTKEGGAAFADTIRDGTARHLALPRTLQGEALDTHLDGLRTDTSYAEWSAKLREAKTEAEMLQAAQKLDDWRKEVKA